MSSNSFHTMTISNGNIPRIYKQVTAQNVLNGLSQSGLNNFLNHQSLLDLVYYNFQEHTHRKSFYLACYPFTLATSKISSRILHHSCTGKRPQLFPSGTFFYGTRVEFFPNTNLALRGCELFQFEAPLPIKKPNFLTLLGTNCSGLGVFKERVFYILFNFYGIFCGTFQVQF